MKYKLSELAFYSTEKIEIDKVDESNYISTENILPNKSGICLADKLPQIKKVNAYKNGDILISNIRPYFKKIWFANRDGGHSADVLNFRAKEGVSNRFLYALLFQDSFFNQMVLSSKGTKMPRGDKNAIMNLEFEVPSYSKQEKISDILFYFQDKIELNNQIISNLEELASTLFKRWFVDFEFPDENGNPYKSSGGKMDNSELGEIPEGWEINPLSSIAKITSGKRPDVKKTNPDKDNIIPIVGASKIMGYTNRVLENGSIITTGRVGTHGIIQRYREKVWVSDNSFIIKSDTEEFLNQILLRIDYKNLNRGSTQPLITQTDLKKYKIVLPSSKFIEMFESVISKLTECEFQIKKQNLNLEKIRDSLLPKLLSGEIELPEDEEA
ncbi:hypothetical protein T481_06680 [Enterococcus faecalis PF3]|nr:hypothetical protein T481_06680 [Enterococcus faecalis PF3]